MVLFAPPKLPNSESDVLDKVERLFDLNPLESTNIMRVGDALDRLLNMRSHRLTTYYSVSVRGTETEHSQARGDQNVNAAAMLR